LDNLAGTVRFGATELLRPPVLWRFFVERAKKITGLFDFV
jgi:hypothetical protein